MERRLVAFAGRPRPSRELPYSNRTPRRSGGYEKLFREQTDAWKYSLTAALVSSYCTLGNQGEKGENAAPRLKR